MRKTKPDHRPPHRKAPLKVWRCPCKAMNEHVETTCHKCGRSRG